MNALCPTGEQRFAVAGVGLGLRRSFIADLLTGQDWPVDFLEIAPENWIGVGGAYGRQLRAATERFPFVSHGLSLSLGGPAPLDTALLQDIRGLVATHSIRHYTEHLSYCSDAGGHLYDLMPIPFTAEAVRHVAARIAYAEDLLGERIAIENVSYYAAPDAELTELEFLTAVLTEADCGLLLDVNNVYVNSINHCYDAAAFIRALPAGRVVYMHVAGHHVEAADLRIDTHGADVCDPVWDLLDIAYEHCGLVPTLLERDFNIPPLTALMQEIEVIRSIQSRHESR
jgi:uncharacterized protein (UPF0276 family)